MLDEVALRGMFLTAADQTRNGNHDGATLTILEACGITDQVPTKQEALNVYASCVALIAMGAEVCAITLREKTGDPAPWRHLDDATVSIRLVTPGGQALSYEDVAEDACWATALRCITAGLNHDFDLLADILKAHIESDGLARLPMIIGDLVSFYLAFHDGHTGGMHHCG